MGRHNITVGRYAMIKKEFRFLSEKYGFKIHMKQKRGAYYYIVWTNMHVNIMVLYDEQVDEHVENPVRIRVYDADSLGTVYDAVEYQDEFFFDFRSPRERIRSASDWLKISIINGIVEI